MNGVCAQEQSGRELARSGATTRTEDAAFKSPDQRSASSSLIPPDQWTRATVVEAPALCRGEPSDGGRGRLLRVAVNRLGEKGNWDLGALKIELNELILEDMPVVVSGFSEIEIDQITVD